MSEPFSIDNATPEQRREIAASVNSLCSMAMSSPEGYTALMLATAKAIAVHSKMPGSFSLQDLMDNFDEQVCKQSDMIDAEHQRRQSGLN